jgi:hypothetical protein
MVQTPEQETDILLMIIPASLMVSSVGLKKLFSNLNHGQARKHRAEVEIKDDRHRPAPIPTRTIIPLEI